MVPHILISLALWFELLHSTEAATHPTFSFSPFFFLPSQIVGSGQFPQRSCKPLSRASLHTCIVHHLSSSFTARRCWTWFLGRAILPSLEIPDASSNLRVLCPAWGIRRGVQDKPPRGILLVRADEGGDGGARFRACLDLFSRFFLYLSLGRRASFSYGRAFCARVFACIHAQAWLRNVKIKAARLLTLDSRDHDIGLMSGRVLSPWRGARWQSVPMSIRFSLGLPGPAAAPAAPWQLIWWLLWLVFEV